MIVCEPTSGLTSRMYVIADAYEMAYKFDQELVIIWRKTSDCDCSYKKVFENDQFSNVKTRVFECNQFDYKFSDMKSNLRLHSFIMFVRELFVRLSYYIKHTIIYNYYRKKCNIYKNSYRDNNALFCEDEAKGNNCFFEAYNCITAKGKTDCIKIRRIFEKEAESVMNCGREHTIGVLIRRADPEPARSLSTTEKFISRMRHEIEIDPKVRFYLATDDWNEQKNLQDVFGDRILSQAGKTLNRSSWEGIHSSIIDIICLSKTKYILGSYHSVFSRFAADYGSRQLYII